VRKSRQVPPWLKHAIVEMVAHLDGTRPTARTLSRQTRQLAELCNESKLPFADLLLELQLSNVRAIRSVLRRPKPAPARARCAARLADDLLDYTEQYPETRSSYAKAWADLIDDCVRYSPPGSHTEAEEPTSPRLRALLQEQKAMLDATWTRTRLRTALMRHARDWIRRSIPADRADLPFDSDDPVAIAKAAARFLRATCPAMFGRASAVILATQIRSLPEKAPLSLSVPARGKKSRKPAPQR